VARVTTILAHIRVHPGSEVRFEELARELYAATHGRESEVRRYEYWRGAEPGSYYTLLAFSDYPAFLAHQTSTHHEDAGPELSRIIESIRLEWVDPIQGASVLPASESAPLPDDADERTVRYAKAIPPAIASWWQHPRSERALRR